MTTIVVTGANGMLGKAMRLALARDSQLVYCFGKDELDISNQKQVNKIIHATQPDYIINCAAYTAVDNAEEEKGNAFLMNATAVEYLAKAAMENQATLIHFSTDYVFDGTKGTPYNEDDATNPINVYGESKLAGELAIQAIADRYFIIRTSWLYAPWGKNFYTFVRDTDKTDLQIVNNQTGRPTSAVDLAEFVAQIIHKNLREYGVYHFANKEIMTWFDFAHKINDELQLGKNITPTNDFPTRAKRPEYSVLSINKMKTCSSK